MTRDLVDQFIPHERGRFGGFRDEERCGNDGARPDLVELMLVFQRESQRGAAIAVSEIAGSKAEWIWLPKTAIKFEHKAKGMVVVTLPERLAKEKGLI